MTNLRLRVLAGILLSLIWVTANVAFASAESAPPSVLALTIESTTPSGTSFMPPSTQPYTSSAQATTPSLPTLTRPPVSSSIPAIALTTPLLHTPVSSSIPAIASPTPSQPAPERNPLRSPTETSPLPITRASGSQLLYTEYRYYERSQDVTALQMELGMRSVDGVYGPKTRKTHINALGGPHNAVIIFYPELFETPTPCSHGCIPGDGHYMLPTLGELINRYFLPEDRELAQKIAFCESSGRTWHIGSDVVSHAYAIGWFQHLAKYWSDRSEKAGWSEYHPFHAEANVAVAAWLYYTSGVHHWNPSRACWGEVSR